MSNTVQKSMTRAIPAPGHIPTIDQVGIEERVARIKTRSIKKETKVQGMKLALSMIDLTTLRPNTRCRMTTSAGSPRG